MQNLLKIIVLHIKKITKALFLTLPTSLLAFISHPVFD